MITKELLDQANKDIKTVPIKGKEYVMVNERVKRFREICPNGSIRTHIISLGDDYVVIQAEVFDENDYMIASGIAHEKEGSNNINRTSYIENCETSAIGRALGFVGIGVDDSIGSAQEVANAILQQADEEQISKFEAKSLTDYISKLGLNVDDVCKHYRVATIEAMSKAEYGKCLKKLMATEEEQKQALSSK